jgi:hypothetical protein
MPDYRAETSDEPKLQAWLHPEEPGWRLVVEYVDSSIRYEPVRSTWMETLIEALEQMDYYWPEVPIWRRLDTGEVVDLQGTVGHSWEKWDRLR